MFPHSFSYTHQSFHSNYVSSPLRPCFLKKKKKESLWFGWGGPAWLHSAAIQFPHPGMKTSDTLEAERSSQREPLSTPVVSSHDRKHSERATKNRHLSLHLVLKSCHLTTSSAFTLADLCKFVCGCIRTDLRRAGASETSPNRCNRLASALESVRKCGFH